MIQSVFKKNSVPEGVSNIIVGGREVGEWMSNDTRVPLVSATGSTRMGKAVGKAVGERLGRSLLELGGNNAIIISKDADLDMALIGAALALLAQQGKDVHLPEG
ncbi:MAG: aldehyde dehydrogenase family protein [Ferruginibacter sp.]